MPVLSPQVAAQLRSVEGEAELLTRVRQATPRWPGRPTNRAARLETLESEGHALLLNEVSPGLVASLRSGIDDLARDGLPAVFLYLSDAVWDLGEQLEARVSELLGRRYALDADAWAWRIEPDARGWAPHRGWSSGVLDRRAPELVNVWVALSDAEVDRSCMHVVPLDRDPHYPTDLPALAVSGALSLPVSAGTVLFWNANLLHWGGVCLPTAKGPRVSCSFNLVRADAVERFGSQPPGDDRLDFVAGQILTYGENAHDLVPQVLEWAKARALLRALRTVPQEG